MQGKSTQRGYCRDVKVYSSIQVIGTNQVMHIHSKRCNFTGFFSGYFWCEVRRPDTIGSFQVGYSDRAGWLGGDGEECKVKVDPQV